MMRIKTLVPAIGLNPIIVKELRSRMRGVRAFATLTGMLLLLGMVSYVLFRMVMATSRYTTVPLSPQVGQTLFIGLAFIELILICGITPAVTSGAISGEKEKQTYEMLLSTPMRPASILWGKLVSAMSYVFLLLFAGVPMASLVFIFGGVVPRDMIKALFVLVVVAVMFGVLGLFHSALFGRTGRSTVISYAAVVLMLFGPLFAYTAASVIWQREPPRWILIPSPLNALFSSISTSASPDSPINMIFSLLGGYSWGRLMGETVSTTSIPRPIYHYSLPFFIGLTIVLYLISTRLVQPAHRWRISLREAVVALAVILLFGGAVAAMFMTSSGRYENFLGSMSDPRFGGVAMPGIAQAVRVERAVEVPAPVVIEGTMDPSIPTPTPLPLPSGEKGPTGEPGVQAEEWPAKEEAILYAATIRKIFEEGGQITSPLSSIPGLYVMSLTDDTLGDPDAPQSPMAALRDDVRSLIPELLANLNVQVMWVDDRSQVPREADGDTVTNGALVTLGNPHKQKDGSVLISANIYLSSLKSMGKTYRLERLDGAWQVSGDTGGVWEK